MPRDTWGSKLKDWVWDWKTKRQFQRGVDWFNAQKFFEAHECWEVIWLKAREPDKTFLQAITQVSAAFHHHSRGNHAGAESLLRKGLRKLEEFPAGYRGLRLEKLRKGLQKWEKVMRTRGLRAQKPKLEWGRQEWAGTLRLRSLGHRSGQARQTKAHPVKGPRK